jgi:NifU-like protein involved in Fe-S cluster formation
MDEAVIKQYRRLLKTGFKYAGSFENPSIFLDSVGENIPICAQIGRDYMHLYINVVDDRIEIIRYLCSCDPTANVAVEVMCTLVESKTLAEASAITEGMFAESVGSKGEDLMKKARGLIELLNRGIKRYQAGAQPLR